MGSREAGLMGEPSRTEDPPNLLPNQSIVLAGVYLGSDLVKAQPPSLLWPLRSHSRPQ